MKTLLSINAHHHVRGGSDVVYFEHSKLFEKHGWNVAYQAMHHSENLPSGYSQYFADDIDHKRDDGLYRKIVNSLKIIYSPEARRKMSALLDDHKVDVAHVHVVFHHQSPSVLFELKKRGIPTVLTAHDFKMICPAFQMRNRHGICEKCKGKRVWNVAINRCMMDSLLISSVIALESAVHQWFDFYGRNVDRVVVPSKFYVEKFVEWGWPKDQLIYVPNAITAAPSPTVPPPGGYFLYFGRLSPEKGVATFIRAAAGAGVSAKIAGTGPIAAELKALATELGADVEFLGFKSGQELWDIVDACRAIVLPSEWYENGPMSAIEANFRSKPILGASIGGIPELIDDGKTGWLFRSGDVDDLAEKLRLVADSSDDDVAEMGRAARIAAEERHSPEAYYDRMTSIYRDLGVAI